MWGDFSGGIDERNEGGKHEEEDDSCALRRSRPRNPGLVCVVGERLSSFRCAEGPRLLGYAVRAPSFRLISASSVSYCSSRRYISSSDFCVKCLCVFASNFESQLSS